MRLQLKHLLLFLLIGSFHSMQSNLPTTSETIKTPQISLSNQKKFLEACKKGDLTTVQNLMASRTINRDGLVEKEIYKNLPPIVAAAQHNQTDIVIFLAQHFANPNISGDVIDNPEDPYVWSAIQWTAFHGNVAATKALLKAGAVPDITYTTSNTALNRAVKHGGPEVLEALLQNKKFKLFIDHQYYEYTPLAKAAALGREKEVQILLQYGANPNAFIKSEYVSDPETTPLVEAAAALQFNIVKKLLEHGAHSSTTTRWGTAIEAAQSTWCFSHKCQETRQAIIALIQQYEKESRL